MVAHQVLRMDWEERCYGRAPENAIFLRLREGTACQSDTQTAGTARQEDHEEPGGKIYRGDTETGEGLKSSRG